MEICCTLLFPNYQKLEKRLQHRLIIRVQDYHYCGHLLISGSKRTISTAGQKGWKTEIMSFIFKQYLLGFFFQYLYQRKMTKNHHPIFDTCLYGEINKCFRFPRWWFCEKCSYYKPPQYVSVCASRWICNFLCVNVYC